jgi:hypothetical protein
LAQTPKKSAIRFDKCLLLSFTKGKVNQKPKWIDSFIFYCNYESPDNFEKAFYHA